MLLSCLSGRFNHKMYGETVRWREFSFSGKRRCHFYPEYYNCEGYDGSAQGTWSDTEASAVTPFLEGVN